MTYSKTTDRWMAYRNEASCVKACDLCSYADYVTLLDKYACILSEEKTQQKKRIYEIFNKPVEELIKKKKLTTGIAVGLGNENSVYNFCWGYNGGKSKLTEHVLFDLASITKLFLGIIYIKLDCMKIVDIESKVGALTDLFPYISDFHIKDIMTYKVELQTDIRIETLDSKDDAIKVLYSIKGKETRFQRYSDMPALVLGELLHVVTGRSFGEWFEELIMKPLQLKETCWGKNWTNEYIFMDYSGEKWLVDGKLVEIDNVYGTVHDPKARLLTGNKNYLCGNAGLFSSIHDIGIIAQALIKGQILDMDSCKKLVRGNSWEDKSERQAYGYFCYKKFEDERQTEIPYIMSANTLAATGYTGTYLLIDFSNKCFLFIGGNRLNSRISKVVNNIKFGEKCINMETGYTSSMDYVYEKDVLRDMGSEITLVLQAICKERGE